MRRRGKHLVSPKSGRLARARAYSLVDRGTPQLQRKRFALVGEGSDPALSASALGILYARARIDREQMDAGARYSLWHRLCFGSGDPETVLDKALRLTGSAGTPDSIIERAERQLAQANAQLEDAERRAVADVAVFNSLP